MQQIVDKKLTIRKAVGSQEYVKAIHIGQSTTRTTVVPHELVGVPHRLS